MRNLIDELQKWADTTPRVTSAFHLPLHREDCYDDGMHDGKIEFAKELIDLLKSEYSIP